ncbi:MAG: sulfite oxidase [Desulfosarcinaceae bacterium]|nr:sulfite oxidase [Desulfosarcinaceae bacterium]
MTDAKRVMTVKPRNAETPATQLRSWLTPNDAFFERNQGLQPDPPIDVETWSLRIEGEVVTPHTFSYADLLGMPKDTVANTLECSGNSRSLLKSKAAGNPWTIGGVGNAVWGGVALRHLLERVGLKASAKHVAFEGLDTPTGKAQIKFIRSIPLAKALDATLLAYEMNGEPLPPAHGFPLRSLALGWTGANCVKWLHRIRVLAHPHEGFFMDKVYRVFQKGMAPEEGTVVTGLTLKSIITQPLDGDQLPLGEILVLGAAYAGELEIADVAFSSDNGRSWQPTEFIGPREPFSWRQWRHIWRPTAPGDYTLLARASAVDGRRQPMDADWNVLGYGNNGVHEHGVRVHIG